ERLGAVAPPLDESTRTSESRRSGQVLDLCPARRLCGAVRAVLEAPELARFANRRACGRQPPELDGAAGDRDPVGAELPHQAAREIATSAATASVPATRSSTAPTS